MNGDSDTKYVNELKNKCQSSLDVFDKYIDGRCDCDSLPMVLGHTLPVANVSRLS